MSTSPLGKLRVPQLSLQSVRVGARSGLGPFSHALSHGDLCTNAAIDAGPARVASVRGPSHVFQNLTRRRLCWLRSRPRAHPLGSSMADKRARWATARTGTLSPWSLAKVWALHAVSKLRKLDLEHTEIAQLVKKAGGGHPTPTAIYKLRKQVEDDPDWHPGKGQETAKRPGPKPRFTPQKKRAGAECAMAMTRRGEGVTVQAAQGRAATSCTNPDTGELFDEKVVLEVFRTMCHDGDPADTWDHYVPYQKTALEPRLLPLRHAWAKKLLGLHGDAGWYYRHCVWFDPCHTVVPKGPRAAFNQRQAGLGHCK